MKLRKKILQGLANHIILILEKEKNERIFNFYLNLAIQLDDYAISKGIYLD